MSNCKSCGAEIQWVEMDSGKKMPLDVKKKTLVYERHINIQDISWITITGFESHFATCPNANTHRKK